MTPTIGLAMIVKNEEARLERCLQSVAGEVDEIVIVDTGSTDATVQIARRYGSKVYRMDWSGDFSAARNFALEHVESKWVLSLDADELLDTSQGSLRSLLPGVDEQITAFFLPLYNEAGETPGTYGRFMVLRFFRNLPEHRFKGRIHEQVSLSGKNTPGVAQTPVIRHRPPTGRERGCRRRRNLVMLEKALEQDRANPFLHYYLGLEWLGLGKPDRALPLFQFACDHLSDSHILFRAPSVLNVVNCHKLLGNYDAALCVCLEEAVRYPVYTDLLFQGGVVLELMGEYPVAVRWFNQALQRGVPPAFFAHTNGTGSFLAHYHLGYCHEKIDDLPRAAEHYKKALSDESGYVYPLYSLFSLYWQRFDPAETLSRFKSAGHLAQCGSARILARLFMESGRPDLAYACLDGHRGKELNTGDDGRPRDLVQILVYSGHPGRALSLAGFHRRFTGELEPETTVDVIIAQLLLGNRRAAKSGSLALWRRPGGRSAAWFLLNLISCLENGFPAGRPEPHREPEVISLALGVLDRCLLFRGDQYLAAEKPVRVSFPRLAEAVAQSLLSLSPGGAEALANFLDRQAAVFRHLMNRRFPGGEASGA